MKKAWLALVFGSALFLAACGGGDDEATNNNADMEDKATDEATDTGDTATGGADAAAGEELVQSSCTSCHGGNLQGMGNTPALSDVGSRLSEEEIHDVIVNGRGGMPKGLLQGEDAEAAAAWLAQQQ